MHFESIEYVCEYLHKDWVVRYGRTALFYIQAQTSLNGLVSTMRAGFVNLRWSPESPLVCNCA